MYGLSARFNGSYQQAIDKVTSALAKEGFGVLTEIDVKATLKKKLDVDTRPYIILGACNPVFAHQVLTMEPDIGLLLPCNVVVREEEDGSITVAIVDPEAMLKLVNNPKISVLASEVKFRLERVISMLGEGE